MDGIDAEEEDRERRRECRDLEAVDLIPTTDMESSISDRNDGSGSRRSSVRFLEDAMTFPGLQRLGLDLSGTRITPDILQALGDSPTVRLVDTPSMTFGTS